MTRVPHGIFTDISWTSHGIPVRNWDELADFALEFLEAGGDTDGVTTELKRP